MSGCGKSAVASCDQYAGVSRHGFRHRRKTIVDNAAQVATLVEAVQKQHRLTAAGRFTQRDLDWLPFGGRDRGRSYLEQQVEVDLCAIAWPTLCDLEQ